MSHLRKPDHAIFRSLAFEIGAIIVLVEILALSLTGGFYINRFSTAVDRRFEASIKIPGFLMAEGALNYSLATDRQRMEYLVGQELEDAILFGVVEQVFYALNPDNMGQHVADIPGLNPRWFDPEVTTEPFVTYVNEGPERYLISVTPIFALDGRTPFLFLYAKMNTRHARAEKATIMRLFLVGSASTIIITSLAIFLFFEFSIFTRLRALLQLFERIEGGDLTTRTLGRIAPDEIGSVQHGVHSMVGKLQEMMTALRSSRKLYQAVVEDMPARICRFAPDGTVTFYNSEYARAFEARGEPLRGQNFFHGFADEEREQVRSLFLALTANAPIMTYTQQLRAPGGAPPGSVTQWQHWTGRAIVNEAGEAVEYQALGRDITSEIQAQEDKAELERQLQQAHKMEAIGTLAGGIAHDFNNILGGIIGYTELVQDEVAPDTHAQRYLSQILKACQRAKALIIQILTFSRQGPVERQPFDLSSLTKEALKLLKATLPEQIAIRYAIESPSNLVCANPTQIHQTIMNLCVNAIQAMHATGGILDVTIREIRITPEHAGLGSELPRGAYIELAIGDTGTGMSQETIQRIFDPYFSTKHPNDGSGLGLSLSLGIVKNHGGAITVQSSPGKGSVFSIVLPKTELATALPEAEPGAAAQHGEPGQRILFVDDEAFLVEIGQEMLAQLGYQVVTAMNGCEALELFQAQPADFDLVITDQTMPNLTGSELAQRLLRLRADIPIILCTGFSEALTEEQAKTLGIREFLLKPLTRGELARAIGHVLATGGEVTA